MEKISKRFMLCSGLLAAMFAMPQAHASDAYLKSARGDVVRSDYGLCWRTGYWTSADAIPECEGGVKQVVEEKKPVAPKAPIKSVTLEADATFAFDKFTLKPAAKAKLDQLVNELKEVEVESIMITGHTDSIGPQAYNQTLSERRAESVRDYLVDHGVDPQKTVTKGMGESQPVATNATKAGRAKNRRVTVEVMGTEK